MGGKKKPTLKQLEKQLKLKKLKAEGKKPKKPVVKEKERKIGGLLISEEIISSIRKEALRAKVITPYTIASKYQLRMSIAKRILKMLEKEGVVKLVSRSRRTYIYTGAQAKVEIPKSSIPGIS